MTAPHDDLPQPEDQGQPSGAELCPRCGVKRVGAFRSCLSCGFDYEAPKAPIFVPPPEDASPPVAQTASAAAPARAPLPAPAAAPPASVPAASPAAAPPVVTRPTPTPSPTTRRPATIGGFATRRARLAAGVAAALIAAAAIVAVGLGRPNSATPASTSTSSSQSPTLTAIPINAACVEQIGSFVKSLESLDSGVGANVTLKDYSQLFAASQAARGSVDISKLDPPCIAVFAAAQAALGEHAAAYNTWNDCTTTTGCTRQSIETALQDHWAKAKATLASVQASMP